MTVRFVDTNVLLYAVAVDRKEAKKAEIARKVLRDRDLGLSTQVLGEFYVQATRASRAQHFTHQQASQLVEAFSRFAVQPVTVETVKAALVTRERYHVSYWDACVIEASRQLGCGEVLTEDLQAGMDFGGVVITNPFATTG